MSFLFMAQAIATLMPIEGLFSIRNLVFPQRRTAIYTESAT